MGTIKDEIRGWAESAKRAGGRWMIVAWDTFETDGPGDYPVTVMPGEDVVARIKKIPIENGDEVIEVYDLSADLEAQLSERRAWHI
jgi:hypothetical protein